jgi:DNA-directed RNA polymerase specialized sigma24 family protein
MVRQYSRLIRAAIGRTGGKEVADLGSEIEQRVLTDLWRQVAGEQVIHHPSSYIYRAAVRETVRVLRREKRHEIKTAAAAVEGVLSRSGVGPERAMQSKQVGKAVDDVLSELTEDRARAVRAHLAGFKVKEIMDMYQWSYQRARNLVARGMSDLRRGLRRRGIDAST